MNTVHMVGKIASEIRIAEYGAGADVKVKASFLLAVPRPVKDGEPDWVRVETWGKQAANLVRFNPKGSRIGVVGRLQSRFYNPDGTDRGGQLRSAVVANEIVYLTGKKAAPGEAVPGEAAPVEEAPTGRGRR